MKPWRALILASAVGSMVAGSSRGQSPAEIPLLNNKGMQADLKVGKEQAEKLDGFAQQHYVRLSEAVQSVEGLPEAEQRARLDKAVHSLMAEYETFLTATLKPDQVDRLRQISHQNQGIYLFNQPEVRSALMLSTEQRTKVTEATREYYAVVREVQRIARTDPEAALKKLAAIQGDAVAKVVVTLNAEQSVVWKRLVGPPFDLKAANLIVMPAGEDEVSPFERD